MLKALYLAITRFETQDNDVFLVRTSYPVHGKLGFDFNTRIGRQSYSFQNHFFGAEVKSELIELSKIFLD